MRIDEIESRKAEIRGILDSEQEFDIDALTEELVQFGVGLKVEIRHIIVMGASEFQNRPGLTYLSGTLQNQGFSVGIFLPGLQIAHDFSIHKLPSLSGLCIAYHKFV